MLLRSCLMDMYCDERFRIQSSLCDQPQCFLTIAAVYTAGLEGEVLAVHIRQRQCLSLVIKRTIVTIAFGLAHSHARRNVDSAPATSRTTSAPPWSLLART